MCYLDFYMSFSFADLGGRRYSHDRYPSQCPICHFSVQPDYRAHNAWLEPSTRTPHLEIVFACPRPECRHLFIAIYEEAPEDGIVQRTLMGMPPIKEFQLVRCAPSTPAPFNLAPEVQQVSSMFPVIYEQARSAEAYGLDQIAGVAYRKALEFLIKDYCISLNPNAADDIKKLMLGPVIKNHVTNPQLKLAAERAVWLGNDETHYERRWEGKDISDLKLLLRLTMTWIETDILTRQFETDMPR